MAKSGVIDLTRNALLITDPERLISYGRAVTVTFAMLAIYLDPAKPAGYRSETWQLLALYAVFTAILLFMPIRRPIDSRVHLAVHMVDAAVLGLVAFLTNEMKSPFFSFLPFILLAMTIRWGLMGAILGGLILETILLAIGVPDMLDGDSELNSLIIRTAYFMVFAVMVGYFGAYRETSRARLDSLANLPLDHMVEDRPAWIAAFCSHAAEVVGCHELVLIWRDQDQPAGSIAIWRSGKFELTEVQDEDYWYDLDQNLLTTVPETGGRQTVDHDLAALTKALAPLSCLAPGRPALGILTAFTSIRFRGIVAVMDPSCRPEDAKALTEIIARRIAGELERFDLMSKIFIAVRSEERERLARDLHDSVLQDLTATSLQLRAASSQAPEVSEQLRAIEALVVEQQRRIRQFVEGQRLSGNDGSTDIADELRKQARLLERKWGIAVTLEWQDSNVMLPDSAAEQITQLVSEATANAVRHGGASDVNIRAGMKGDEVLLSVRDNGKGLDRARSPDGSNSLRSRIRFLGGAMSLRDALPGLEVTMRVPVGKQAA